MKRFLICIPVLLLFSFSPCFGQNIKSDFQNITRKAESDDSCYPNRGLEGREIIPALDYYGVKYRELSRSVASSESFIVEQGYHDFLYKQVIATVKNGNPVMIGVKNNPDMNINWTWDHALLVVGYNEITDELIYNDFNNRKRMPAGQLITKDGRI